MILLLTADYRRAKSLIREIMLPQQEVVWAREDAEALRLAQVWPFDALLASPAWPELGAVAALAAGSAAQAGARDAGRPPSTLALRAQRSAALAQRAAAHPLI